jgi:hypothetical protein
VNAIEADHAGRISVGVINKQFMAAGGSAEEYRAAVAAAVTHSLAHHASVRRLPDVHTGRRGAVRVAE